ncbi:MAG: helix-hairpin-helix domain-containing protein, partial [Aeromonas sp.]
LIIGETHEELNLPVDMPALHLIQHIRDESHRFAITGHRARRAKARVTSSLEEIPGVGPKRRQALLKYLGGLQEVKRAGVEELAKVPGINQALAEAIHAAFHGANG